MEYRKFGELEWRPSALGFGAMRLPYHGDDRGNIKEDEAIKMIRHAIDKGVNYVDTAWPYHDEESEELVGKALKDGYREKVKVATKLPSWDVEDSDDPDEILNKQLDKLDVDKIDFYLLHALSRKHWENYQSLDIDIFEWMKEKREEGKIDHLGFSFHDDLDTFKEIVDTYDWDFCQIQYNYLDQEFQAGREGLKYASNKGLGVVIMEPLRGGKLAKEPPEEIKEIWDEAEEDREPVEWALKWLWNQPEVSLVLSGMSELEQVKENVRYASKSGVGVLSDRDLEIVDRVAERYREISPVECTGCNYCVPCPNDVAIPRNFRMYNQAEIYDEYEKYKEIWDEKMKDESKAMNCVRCGQCEEVCPQDLEIMSLLEDVTDYFEN
ncbi:MAG: aldo/keto reductase [Candidatus Thermoplasmatota archaeon]